MPVINGSVYVKRWHESVTGLSARISACSRNNLHRNQYPEEANKMSSFAERYREEGMQQGKQQGIQQGEVAVLLRLMERKFGHRLTETDRRLVESADAETLLKWSDKILSANSIEEVLH